MGLFGKLVRTAVNTALLPVEVVKDVTTLGGIATEQKKPYTQQRIEKLIEDAEND